MTKYKQLTISLVPSYNLTYIKWGTLMYIYNSAGYKKAEYFFSSYSLNF